MNKQIQEFMQQAGTDVSGKWMSVDNATKFAELIVQECVSIMVHERQRQLGEFYTNVNGTADDFIHMSGASLTVDRINKHFGVEE